MKQFRLTSYWSFLLILLLFSCSQPIDCSVEDCQGEFYNGSDKFAPMCDEIDAITDSFHDYEDGTGWLYESMESKDVGVMFHNEKPYTGKVKACYDNGRVKSITSFKNGIHDGEAKWYHENGLLSCKFTYKDGIIEGERLDFYENGMINEKGVYWNDEVDSKWYLYDEDGKLLKVSTHKGGEGYIGKEIECWGDCD